MAKDILKNSIWYTILGFLPLSFAFFFTPIYLKYLDKSEYGLLNLFLVYSGIITQIYSMGVSTAFGFFYWDVYKERVALKELISSTLGLLLVFQFIYILIGLLFGKSILGFITNSSNEFTYNPFFISTLLYSAFMVFYDVFLYYFRNEGKLKEYSALSISTLFLLTIGTLVGIVFLDLKAIGAIWGRTFGYGIVVTAFFVLMVKRFGISFNFKKSKTLLLFSLPLFVNGLVGAVSHNTDRLLIEQLDSLSNLGLYGFALVFITVIEIWFNALNNSFSPYLYMFMNESPDEKHKEIKGIAHLIIISVLILICIMIALSLPVMKLIIPENFYEAGVFIPILGGAFIWRVFTNISSYSLYLKKESKFFLINQSSNLIVTIVFGYLAYQKFGIIGIAYTVYFVKLLEFIIMSFISNKIKPLNLKLKYLVLFSLLIGVSSFVSSYLFPIFQNQYLLYCLPLITFIFLVPILLKVELKNIFYVLKHRKELF